MKKKQRLVRCIARFTAAFMTVSIVIGSVNFNVSAKTGSALDIGSPTFKNTDTLTYYDHEVDYHQDDENDQTDQKVATNHKITEGHDYLAGSVGSLVAVEQDHPGGGYIQRETE